MQIQCPSCRLTGSINDADIPVLGKRIACPRCKAELFVEKPAASVDNAFFMSICPVCQYSTFTDETFAVCPSCGTNGADYRSMLLAKTAPKQKNPGPEKVSCNEQVPPPDREQMLREYELLHRSKRNPQFEELPQETVRAKRPALALPLKIAGSVAVAAGVLFLLHGLFGLAYYYGDTLQPNLSTEYLGTMFSVRLFFLFGLFPWVRTVFALCFLVVASQFFSLRPWVPQVLQRLSLIGLGLILVQELFAVTTRIITASGSPSALFYVSCLINFLVSALLWSAPFLAVLWLLRKDDISTEYCRACAALDDSIR